MVTTCGWLLTTRVSTGSTRRARRCADRELSMYLEKFRVPGRVALVTGARRGIRPRSLGALAEAGAKTILAAQDAGSAESGRDALRAKGYDPVIVIMDVTQSARVNAVADDLVGRHGRVDILVNNAGIARSETPAETVEDEHWLNVID